VAGTALPGRLTWRAGTVAATRDETPTARTIALDVPGWPGHLAGQHVDVRLTAPDGYSAVRSYSLAAPANGQRLEITVEVIEDGEVSPYLVHTLVAGNPLEVRGPIGGWFVWRPEQTEPVQLVAGGSGLVPLMAMLRARTAAKSGAPFRLLYSVRTPGAVLYAAELAKIAAAHDDGVAEVTIVYTRVAPPDATAPAGRLDAARLQAATFPPDRTPTCYVCGPTPFVESVATALTAAGHPTKNVKTERFGPSGGPS
jgi:ferredoxin-NADP reductase